MRAGLHPIFALLAAAMCAAPGITAAQAAVKIEPATLDGPRALAPQTAQAAIRDYIEAWQSLSEAMNQNRPDLLNADFVGDARDELAGTIRDQSKQGLRSVYQDKAHDVRIVFYSPEGLSIELEDTVDYDVQVMDRDKAQGSRHVHARYVVVLTPSELRWRVRVMQADAE
jgi:hypothetical protein